MSIETDARQEAERRWPSYPAVGFSGASDRQQAFIDGAIWASEQAEAIDRMGPAAGCVYCVGAGGYEDYDGEWRECSCQRADRGCGHPNHGAEDHDCAPFLSDREPSEEAVEKAAIAIGRQESCVNPKTGTWYSDVREATRDRFRGYARTALLATQGVRRADAS